MDPGCAAVPAPLELKAAQELGAEEHLTEEQEQALLAKQARVAELQARLTEHKALATARERALQREAAAAVQSRMARERRALLLEDEAAFARAQAAAMEARFRSRSSQQDRLLAAGAACELGREAEAWPSAAEGARATAEAVAATLSLLQAAVRAELRAVDEASRALAAKAGQMEARALVAHRLQAAIGSATGKLEGALQELSGSRAHALRGQLEALQELR